jgi:hypothetical protein
MGREDVGFLPSPLGQWPRFATFWADIKARRPSRRGAGCSSFYIRVVAVD